MLTGSNVSMTLLAEVLSELPGQLPRARVPVHLTAAHAVVGRMSGTLTAGRGTSGKRLTEGNV
jgi:hypothetical protein